MAVVEKKWKNYYAILAIWLVVQIALFWWMSSSLH